MFYWSFLGFMKHLDAVLKNAVILKSKHGFLNFGKKMAEFYRYYMTIYFVTLGTDLMIFDRIVT